MLNLHTVWEEGKSPISLPEGISVRWYYDEDYTPFGSFAYDSEEETKAAERQEAGMLDSGEYVALGCVIMDDEKGDTVDSLWGIVTADDEDSLVEFFEGSMEFPDPLVHAQKNYDAALERLKAAREVLLAAMVKDAQKRN